MRQEAGGEIAVSAAPFMNHERWWKLFLIPVGLVKFLRQSVRQSIVTTGECLVEVLDAAATQSVEHGVEVGLPFIDRPEIPHALRGRLFVRGNTWKAHGRGILTNAALQDNQSGISLTSNNGFD